MAENYDLYASMFGGIPEAELQQFDPCWSAFPSLRDELFSGENGYLRLRTENIKETIHANADVRKFQESFHGAFADFGDAMDSMLIDSAETLSIPKTEEEASGGIFRRFENIPLLDPYQAYDIFENQYNMISGDLELIQTEGRQAVRQVDPNMVIRKQNGKDAEVQDGWKGHILPFDLVQQFCLPDQLKAISDENERLSEIPAACDELLESLSEDDKETISDALTEENDAFIAGNIKTVMKALKADPETDPKLIQVLKKAEELSAEEKSLKKKIRQDQEALQIATKAVIENLTDADAKKLLHEKWITPVYSGIFHLSDEMLDQFTKDIASLADKYAVTMNDLEKEIHETEKSLSAMLTDLTGSESDMEGIRELRQLLGGAEDE